MHTCNECRKECSVLETCHKCHISLHFLCATFVSGDGKLAFSSTKGSHPYCENCLKWVLKSTYTCCPEEVHEEIKRDGRLWASKTKFVGLQKSCGYAAFIHADCLACGSTLVRVPDRNYRSVKQMIEEVIGWNISLEFSGDSSSGPSIERGSSI